MTDEEREWFQASEPSLWERLWERWSSASSGRSSYYWVRFAMLRLLGLVYLVAFWGIVEQGPGLIGSDGLTPATAYLERLEELSDSRVEAFFRLPTLFWLRSTDAYLSRVAFVASLLSLAVLLGYANAILLGILWFLHLSFVHVGQDWYAFGWEIQLVETGFLAIFLCPLLDGRPFASRPPPVVVIWLYRWLIFRIMLGAGLIKLRGDVCWTDLTCLLYHYETQPIPNPLSSWFHFLPVRMHELGVLFNHLCELVAPFFAFGPRRARLVAGTLFVTFQLLLIASGNLAFLNWLTIIPALACFDDGVVPRSLRGAVAPSPPTLHRGQRIAALGLAVVVAFGSLGPIRNLLSSRQVMNTSFGSLHLVNTYGAFGTVGRERLELVIEGTDAGNPGDPGAVWTAYTFPCKPTKLDRRPCVASPYHYRLDWLLWFAAMGSPRQYPWTVHLVWKLLANEPSVLGLVAENPFPEAPPRFIRIELYRYAFAPSGEAGVWRRERLSTWLAPVSRDDPRLVDFLEAAGFVE